MAPLTGKEAEQWAAFARQRTTGALLASCADVPNEPARPPRKPKMSRAEAYDAGGGDDRERSARVTVWYGCGCRVDLQPPVLRVAKKCAEHGAPQTCLVEIVPGSTMGRGGPHPHAEPADVELLDPPSLRPKRPKRPGYSLGLSTAD